ncbi:dihydrolipoyl dehydrogenase family protein [Desulfosediminicola flagellatus]|uniref:dihydrolipoyl dehydrogenase family protein n=1 Tax=Desulfosediminicola flagellatus TaxID=2569541 RepID=UPI0010ABBC74|nr:NAD(P)/FAD-dependent oxidoreductase [Desulfosediminicola flagellatus]
MNRYEYDVIVIGSGTSAYYAIDGLSKNSTFKIAVVDERPYGGTCALRGCQPKKYLVSNAEAVAMANHLHGRGITSTPTTDWKALQDLKNEFLKGRSEADVKHWKKKGVATYHGRARMTADNEVQVGNDLLQANRIILATGAVPRHSDIEGSEFLHDSEYFLDMPDLPKRIVFIGGGYISFEFAHVAARTGAQEVVIMNRSSRPLRSFDNDIVTTIMQASAASGINVLLNTSPSKVIKNGNEYLLHTSTGDVITTDLIIEATGRIPNLSVLDGEKGNVSFSSKGVIVNDFLQSTTNPKVYAIGDCAATPYMLAPVADKEGQTVVQNIVNGNSTTIDYSEIPSAVFTIPNIGSVGLTEEQAKENGLDIRVNQGTTTQWPSSKRIGEEHASYKVIIDNSTDLIVGAHIARHNSSEVINVFALAIKFKITAKNLADFMWAYPTYTSDLKYMVK